MHGHTPHNVFTHACMLLCVPPRQTHTLFIVIAIGSNHNILLGGEYYHRSGFLEGDSEIEFLLQVIYGEVLSGVGGEGNKGGRRELSKNVVSAGDWLLSGEAPGPGLHHRVDPRHESSFCGTISETIINSNS